MKKKSKDKPTAEDLHEAERKESVSERDEPEKLHEIIENLKKEKDELFEKLQRFFAADGNCHLSPEIQCQPKLIEKSYDQRPR